MKTVKIAAISFSVVVAAAALGACSTPPQQAGRASPHRRWSATYIPTPQARAL